MGAQTPTVHPNLGHAAGGVELQPEFASLWACGRLKVQAVPAKALLGVHRIGAVDVIGTGRQIITHAVPAVGHVHLVPGGVVKAWGRHAGGRVAEMEPPALGQRGDRPGWGRGRVGCAGQGA